MVCLSVRLRDIKMHMILKKPDWKEKKKKKKKGACLEKEIESTFKGPKSPK